MKKSIIVIILIIITTFLLTKCCEVSRNVTITKNTENKGRDHENMNRDNVKVSYSVRAWCMGDQTAIEILLNRGGVM